ncbi:MAG TPA: MaoC/PaaZ C-terminal domain-containing protein [Rhodanobacter sp.]|nr:MaoC/PaaZ C-terminal domain-containing protein [Acetobacteraceae bacterium]HVC16037.1 MaoC/PaaZ C-terminal domain-containing protein [Rhodanobacter sp.]
MPPPSRRFTLADQQAFAALSGDHNPMHLDPQVARRLFLGEVVVHGVHLVLWSLESLLAAGMKLSALASLRVRFDQPAGLERDVALRWQTTDDRAAVTAQGAAGRLMRLNLRLAAPLDRAWEGPRVLPPLACQVHGMEDLTAAAGSLPLVLSPDFAVLFPRLAAGFSPLQSAILLASTRLVGMVCPGLHSIYTGLSLSFTPELLAARTLDYAVSRADARVRLVDIALNAPGLHGRLETLLRPEPVAQPRFAELRNAMPHGSFAGQRALVIGGARGLGELTAKLLTIAGADVTITYRHGADDAARVIAEAAAAGHVLRALRFNIAAPPADAPVPPGGFTHAYYFATPRIIPRIASGPIQDFAAASFAQYLDYYATGLARSLEWLRPRAVTDLCVWYPSTVFVGQEPPGLAEYAAAKACGEALCAQLTARLAPVRVLVERLPRLATDQTQFLTGLSLAGSVATLRAALLRLA